MAVLWQCYGSALAVIWQCFGSALAVLNMILIRGLAQVVESPISCPEGSNPTFSGEGFQDSRWKILARRGSRHRVSGGNRPR